jgi:hypothetical protein
VIERYKELATEAAQLEAALEKNKGERAQLAKALRDKNGAKYIYDLGDGVPMIVSVTKIGTCFFAPKNKWTKAGPRPPKPPKEPKTKRRAKAKAEKVVMKRAIVNGQIVEVPVTPRKPASTPPPAKPQPAVAVTQPTIALSGVSTASTPEGATGPASSATQKVVPATPTATELPDDPLERAMALVDRE